MNRIFRAVLLVAILSAALAFYHFLLHPAATLTPVSPMRTLSSRVVLVPLDSRPPCRQQVADLGRIAGLDVITPPAECMDYYSQPGDTMALRRWLQDNLAGRQAAILSIDQLLYGGLKELGFECAKPQGAFYLFVKAPDGDDARFVDVCKKYNVLVVPGKSFACAGYVRLAYCVSNDMIRRSLPAFRKIAEEYGL